MCEWAKTYNELASNSIADLLRNLSTNQLLSYLRYDRSFWQWDLFDSQPCIQFLRDYQ